MESNPHILAAAQAAIISFGARAPDEMQKRADAHRKAADAEGAAFWQRVASAAREILSGGMA